MIGNTTTELAMAYLLNDEMGRARALLDPVVQQDTGHYTRAERRMLWAKGNLFLAENKPAEALQIAEHLLDSKRSIAAHATYPGVTETQGRVLVSFEAIQESRASPGGSQSRAQGNARPFPCYGKSNVFWDGCIKSKKIWNKARRSLQTHVRCCIL